MRRTGWVGLVAALLLSSTAVWAQRAGDDVEISVTGDGGRSLREYPVRSSGSGVYKAYLEARRGQNYSVTVRNRTNERIGVVIAVDGRNIISGDRSNLRANERMYVLQPRQRESYSGWRTGKNRVNRFYFTDAGDSYASAWGDESAMGVIAVAAFREARQEESVQQPWTRQGPGHSDQRGLRRGPMASESPAPRSAQSAEPGTGYGEKDWSPSRRVEFDPEQRAFQQVFLKYAWRETLCRQGIADNCRDERPQRRPRNRFWDDDDGYAPPPPPARRFERDSETWR